MCISLACTLYCIVMYKKKNELMIIDNLTEQDIKDLIIQFNLDESIDNLKRYYATSTTWNAIKQSRRETSHTQFLAWFFRNKEFNADPYAGPIKRLIVLLLKWANKQDRAHFDDELANSIYAQNLSILSYDVTSEKEINVPTYGQGNIDIFITCEAKVNDSQRNINIVIENKIGSPETTKKETDKNGKELTLYQTEAYYQYITKEYKDDINLFVFLKPTDCDLENITEAECKCKEYIQINYQVLLDNIIQPIYDQEGISAGNRSLLKEYIKILGKPAETENSDKNTSNTYKTIKIAMTEKEREMLKTFFKNNEDLIRATINALGDEELSQSMAEIDSKGQRQRNKYKINGNGSYTMYEVLEGFVKYRLKNSSVSVKDIDHEIADYINSGRVNVSDTQNHPVFQEGKKNHGAFLLNGREIRYTKQWSDGGSNPTFTRFREGVNNDYPHFQIDVI